MVLGALALGFSGWRMGGWLGLGLVLSGLVMWFLLYINRVLAVLKRAADRPIGYVGSAVMLNAKLKPDATLLHVVAMTKALGKELAKYDIAVNAISPATAKTRILDELKPEFIDYMLSRIPRGRFLEVDEAAAMVAWLVSKENSFTTASVFDLSGGRTTY